MPEDSAARSDPDPVGERAGDVDGGAGGGDVRVRIRWALVVSALVAALALLFAQTSGYAATFGVTLALAFVVAWGWPLLTGSFTPTATTVVLAVAALAIVLATRRDDLLWVPAAVAFGMILAFLGQLVRRTGREGLVLTLLSSFGGLVVIASAATAVVAVDTSRGQAVAVVAMAAVAAAVVTELVAGVRIPALVLGGVALVVAALVAVAVATRFAEIGPVEALVVGAVVGAVSWAFRRVLAPQPATPVLRGQLAAGAGSVLVVGAVVHLVTALT